MKSDNEIKELDEKMESLGMITLSKMIESNPMGKFSLHKGVDNLDLFGQWLEMRYVSMMKMKCRFIIDKKEDDELYEWVLAHAAVLGEVRAQFKACTPDSGNRRDKHD